MLTTEPRSETAQPTGSTALIAEIAALRAQRDALLAALRDIVQTPAEYDVCPDVAMRMYERARAAIAKAVQS